MVLNDVDKHRHLLIVYFGLIFHVAGHVNKPHSIKVAGNICLIHRRFLNILGGMVAKICLNASGEFTEFILEMFVIDSIIFLRY